MGSISRNQAAEDTGIHQFPSVGYFEAFHFKIPYLSDQGYILNTLEFKLPKINQIHMRVQLVSY